ncbi:hypothetical protein RclHR1_11260005 [Rhizophagus clarus]|uniref:Uncharacterized protein n=1 Tax=Rhizophagus clarus TaxID=94130 RepID=A0A2Z6QIQ1_9GLOM|nr:hypothetical protein RclHR1_11260005 [Rhizophagus clarus]GES91858.1 hypothetical protein GLOIN_2v1783804 [Rhizophagus clarus]
MNSNYSNNQLYDSGNNLSSQMNPATNSRMDIPYVDVQNANIHLSNQYYNNLGGSMMEQVSVNTNIVQDNIINQLVHPNEFTYRLPNDLNIYHIKCREISVQLLNDNESNINFNQNVYIFYYRQQQSNNRIYQIVCEIISPSFIINFLNKSIYGIEIEQNIGCEELTFKFDQKENLKSYLTQYLNRFLLN